LDDLIPSRVFPKRGPAIGESPLPQPIIDLTLYRALIDRAEHEASYAGRPAIMRAACNAQGALL
jgi:hypothetical protein